LEEVMDSVRPGNGQTGQGLAPATPTERDARAPHHHERADAEAQPAESVHGSVIIEELSISAMMPVDSELGSDMPDALAGRRHEPVSDSSDDGNTVLRRPASLADLPRGTLIGEYELERKIGEGGMGSVYAATHPVLGKRVAIKIIGDELSKDVAAITRFRREARAIAQLASPHIVGAFGFGELPDGRSYFVMEFLVGESLHERLARGRLALDEALEVIDQVARGLEAAHEAGIIHRDLKPENIFIERSRNGAPHVKLVDFGIVKLANGQDDVSKTRSGALIGTPLYCSPEQIKESSGVDHRADIYSLGCVAFEMIVGRVPFQRANVMELVAAHLECAPPQPRSLRPELPPTLDALLLAMLAKDRHRRPSLGFVQETIEKLRRAAFPRPTVETAIATVGTKPAPPQAAGATLSTRRHSPGRRLPRAVIASALAAAPIAIIVTIAIARGGDSSTATTPVATHASDAGVSVASIEVPPTPPAAPPPTSTPAATIAAAPVASPRAPAAPAPANVARSPAPTAPIVAAAKRATPAPAITRDSDPAPPPADGELDIRTRPPCDVAIDGKPIGRHTPILSLHVEAGIHGVTLTNAQYGIAETITKQVLPGQNASIDEDYSSRIKVDPNGTLDPFKRSR
jgi:eukaryotic-like serine/threonine-protein kinase